jgi:hypothetical protein
MTELEHPEGTGVPSENDEVSNPKRGCGYLKKGKAYLRGLAGTGRGVLPSFVRCDPPIPFREVGTNGDFTRSYKEIDGLTLQLQTSGHVTEYTPVAPGGEEAYESAYPQMVEAGMYESEMAIPEAEVDRHIDRVKVHGQVSGAHWGEIDTAHQTDLLMRAGESYYPEPEDFIEEVTELGVSKAIPVSSRSGPPEVVRGVTRLWIMHPNAGGEDFGGGIIGYCYLDTPMFTEPEDESVPSYIEEMEQTGDIEVRKVGPEDPDAGVLGSDEEEEPDHDDQQTFGEVEE